MIEVWVIMKLNPVNNPLDTGSLWREGGGGNILSASYEMIHVFIPRFSIQYDKCLHYIYKGKTMN